MVAFVLELMDSLHNMIAANVVPGHSVSQSSFCSELAGIFGQVTMVNAICAVYNITSRAIVSGCDGKVALEQVSLFHEQVDTNVQHFDLISAIRTALRHSPITWTFKHVKGHQDEDVDATLNHWALLNIQMDNLAKAYWLKQCTLPQLMSVPIEGAYWPVFINGMQIHSALRTTMYEEIYCKKMAQHWEQQEHMSQEQSILVNWDDCDQAMKWLKIHHQHWVAKHSEGMCGVGWWMLKWKEHDMDQCP
jgi:hypothetical protein